MEEKKGNEDVYMSIRMEKSYVMYIYICNNALNMYVHEYT